MAKSDLLIDNLRKILVRKNKWQIVPERQRKRLLKDINWVPDLLLKYQSKIIAVDLNLNDTFPVEGAKEILKAKQYIKGFEFYFCIPQYHMYEQIFSECFSKGFGILKLEDSKTVLLLDPQAKKTYKKPRKIKSETGHIPIILLDYIKTLNYISYKSILKSFASKYLELRKGKDISDAEYDLVDKTIKKIFDNKKFHYSSEPYLRLKYYEPLLTGTREHYLHSFQIMLMGCVVIDKYYQEFIKYYKNIFPHEKDFDIGYIWLMVSIFHDIGYPSQKANNLIGEQYGYTEEISITGLEKIAEKVDYRQAAIQMQSFIRHCCCKKIKNNWVPEIMEDEDSEIQDVLREYLINRRSHGVTSCFQFLSRILRESRVASERANRPLIVTHVIPAVASIALHDCRIWDNFRKLNVFPINITRFPFAVLLIFLDSLHDWKRNNLSEEIPEFAIFDGFTFTDNCVEVKVYWADPIQLAKKMPEYIDVKENIKFNGLRLKLPDNLLR